MTDSAPKVDKHVSAIREVLEDLEVATAARDWATTAALARNLLSLASKIMARATTVLELRQEGVL